MTYERLKSTVNEEESKQTAEIMPRPPLSAGIDKRITPHDLFSLFTATIILQNESFVR